MLFRELISEIQLTEIFDSTLKIIKTTKEDNVERYYVDINSIPYRLFIETIQVQNQIGLHIGFERFEQNKWTIKGISNDISSKDVMSIFGTLYNIIKTKKFQSIHVFTKEFKKYMLYTRILNKLGKELGIAYEVYSNKNDEWTYLSLTNEYSLSITQKIQDLFKVK